MEFKFFFFFAVQITQSDVRLFRSQIRKFGIYSEEATQGLVCQGKKEKKKETDPVKAEGLFCGVKGKERCFPISAQAGRAQQPVPAVLQLSAQTDARKN